MTVLSGLYVVTPASSSSTQALRVRVDAAVAGGARLVQYRDKSASPATRFDRAQALLDCCQARGVPLIINDDVELAAKIGADGVHLGRDDRHPKHARARLGAGALIGVSCYACLDRALAAEADGADYLAFGSFYPSTTKPDAVRAEVGLLREARRLLRRPLVAIGGITPDNGALLVAAGADMLAVVSGVFDASDNAAAAGAYSRLFPTEESR